MKIREILGLTLSEEEMDMVDCFLVERFNSLTQVRTDEDRKNGVAQKYDRLEELVMEHYSEDKEESRQFMDWIAGRESENEEDIYLYGIRDGIRAAKQFLSI